MPLCFEEVGDAEYINTKIRENYSTLRPYRGRVSKLGPLIGLFERSGFWGLQRCQKVAKVCRAEYFITKKFITVGSLKGLVAGSVLAT